MPKAHNISIRMTDESHNKLLFIQQHHGKDSIGKVSKSDVLKKCLNVYYDLLKDQEKEKDILDSAVSETNEKE